jgi:diguanylate cyclase (GGDEF)-like protein/PAS domain S-box-containing protein
MAERAELIEAALESFPQGIALLDEERRLVLWNRAAAEMTGFAAADLVGHSAPESLRPLLNFNDHARRGSTEPGVEPAHGFRIQIPQGQDASMAVIARALLLRDEHGRQMGTSIVFHSMSALKGLPQGEAGDEKDVEASQDELKECLESLYEDLSRGGPAFGVLWITVDQAHELRKTHGSGACASMIEKVERSLGQGLRAGEHLGRWGEDEFLVVSREQTRESLMAHARTMASLVRVTDFRWWGDRITITVSIGAATAAWPGSLISLLERAKAAMHISFHAGGNQTTQAPEVHACSPS